MAAMWYSYVDTYSYLGHIIGDTLDDEENIKLKMRQLYGRSNHLSKNINSAPIWSR